MADPVIELDLGRYQLLARLHEGEVADIYLARQWGDGGFQRPVVIKRLHDHHVDDSYALIQFQDEGMLLAALSHRAFPQVHDLRCAGRVWFMAMELVPGRRLDSILPAKDADPLPLGVALSVASQLCSALSHLHKLRSVQNEETPIVHCKVAPGNIVVTPDGIVKLLDLGAARSSLRRHQRSEIHETVAYMAPEQISGGTVDPRTDVYSLGAVLYEMTTGRLPFEGDDLELSRAIAEEEVPLPTSFFPAYPAEFELILCAALSRNADGRFESAAQLSRAIDAFALRDGILTGPNVIANYVRSVFGDREPHPALLEAPVQPKLVIGESVSPDEVEWVE